LGNPATLARIRAVEKRNTPVLNPGQDFKHSPNKPTPKSFGFNTIKSSNGQVMMCGQLPSSEKAFSDIKRKTFRYLAGFIYTGNGTNGNYGELYYVPQYWNNAVSASIMDDPIPVLPADILSLPFGSGGVGGYGDPSVSSILSRFARARFHGVRLCYAPLGLGSGTNTAGNVWIAPLKGGTLYANTFPSAAHTGTTGYKPALARVSGMQNATIVPVSAPFTMDVTQYIAGGTGPKCNEFAIYPDISEVDMVANVQTLGKLEIAKIAPLSFVIGGLQSTVTTGGLNVLMGGLWIEIDVDLLDFISNYPLVMTSAPYGVAPSRTDEKAVPARSLPAESAQKPIPPGGFVEFKDLRPPTLRREVYQIDEPNGPFEPRDLGGPAVLVPTPDGRTVFVDRLDENANGRSKSMPPNGRAVVR
jgi:hypothetical protein